MTPGTHARLDSYPFALGSELRDAANEHGYRIGPEQAAGWLFFRSASAPGEIALAAVGAEGPFFVSVQHHGAARDLGAEPAAPCAKGHAGAFILQNRDALSAAVSAVYRFSMSLPTLPLERFEAATAHLGDTETERLVRVRIGQDIFRTALLEYWNATCPLTGIADKSLLRASHIIPWADCTSDAQRLDAHNGLLLSALWDAAFDDGLVSFDDDGRVLVSPLLSDAAAQELGVERGPVLKLQPGHRGNLAYHRANVWRVE
jgi:hypothetical protein